MRASVAPFILPVHVCEFERDISQMNADGVALAPRFSPTLASFIAEYWDLDLGGRRKSVVAHPSLLLQLRLSIFIDFSAAIACLSASFLRVSLRSGHVATCQRLLQDSNRNCSRRWR